jgi:hypothetical protein
LPAQAREKLEQKVIDFERLDEAELQDGKWDVVFITYVIFPLHSLLLFFGSLSAMTGALMYGL